MRQILFLISVILLFALFSCNGSSTKTPDENDSTKVEQLSLEDYGLDSAIMQKLDTIHIGDIGGVIQSFPSPVEMAALIQDMDVDFSRRSLFSTDLASDFDTNFKKALGLGLYSADLGYLNVYNRPGEVIQYLVSIKKLSDDLRVGQFFDFQSLKRIATNNTNLDSLLILSVQSYFRMDEYLRANNRSNLSALMVTGVWFESLFLAGQVYKEKANDELRERIGGQKDILTDLMAILIKFADTDNNYKVILGGFYELYKAYEKIEIEIIKKDDQVKVFEDGTVQVTQGNTSIIHISNEQALEIIQITEKVRNTIETKLQ